MSTNARPYRRAFWRTLLLFAVIWIGWIGPHSRPLHASSDPLDSVGDASPPPPKPLAVPPDAYDTPPAAPVGYLPASTSVTSSGQLAVTLPIDTPPARGMGPSLSFAYTSTQEDGLLGVGWSLAGLSAVTRCRKTIATHGRNQGVTHADTDGYCLDGQPLVLVNAAYDRGCKEYRTERDVFARVVGCGDTVSGPSWFRVWTKDGEIRLYDGIRYVSTEEGPYDVSDVLAAWPLRDAQDRSGNLVRHRYEVHQDTGEVGFHYRPIEIEYTRKAAEPPFVREEAGLRKVVFEYEDRPDPSNRYFGGIRYGTPQRLAAVSLVAPNPQVPEEVGRYELSYETSPSTGRSLLRQVRRCDHKSGPARACLWAKQFTWWQSERPDFTDHSVLYEQVLSPEVAHFTVADFTGDGKDDLLAQIGYRSISDEDPLIYLLRGTDTDPKGLLPPILVNDPYSYTTAFHFVDLAASRAVDLDADGRMELLAYLRPPLGAAPYVPGFHPFRWNEAEEVFEPFGEHLESGDPGAAQLVDFEGDGLIDLLRTEPQGTLPRWLLHRNVGGHLSAPQPTPFMAFEPKRAVGMDINGDHRGELFVVDPVEGHDASRLTPLGYDEAGQLGVAGVEWVVSNQSQGAIPPVFADINGDGLKDALSLFRDPKQVRYNTGKRFLPPEPLDIPGQLVDTAVLDNGLRVADFDGDGREDLLSLEGWDAGDSEVSIEEYIDRLGETVGQQVMRLYLSRPHGFVRKDLGVTSGYKAKGTGWTTTQLGDFNGDGWVDIARMPVDPIASGTANVRVKVLLQNAPAPANGVSDLLFEVADERSPVTRHRAYYHPWIPREQGPRCTYPQLCLRRAFPVVSRFGSESIEPAVTRWTSYRFDDPRADLRGRGFLGFGEVDAYDSQLRIVTTTRYDHATRIGERYPFAGLPRHVTQIVPLYELPTDDTSFVFTPEKPILGRVTSMDYDHIYYPLNGGATYHTPVSTWRTVEFETDVEVGPRSVKVVGPNGAQERRTEGTASWDDFGNLTYALTYVAGGSARLVQLQYENRTDDWHIGLLRRSSESVGALGKLPDPRVVAHDYDARGRLERTTTEPDDPAYRRRILYLRNADGLVERVRESVFGEPVRTTYLAYDDTERMFVRAVWNDLGHYHQSVTHPALGVPLLTQDPNGVQVRRRYDTFGRIVRIEPEGRAPVDVEIAADDRADAAHPRGLAITEKSAGGAHTVFVDEQGRVQQTATLAFDGRTIVHEIGYNAFGQAVREHRPGFGAASPHFTEITYDSLGRVVAEDRPDGSRASTAYSMFEVLHWDFDHHLSRIVLDQDGRPIESARWTDHWIPTRYAYGDFGALSDVWDPEENHTQIEYDRLGRRTLLDDPDKGITTYAYNGFGELREQDDADPATPPITLHRDVLGRVTSREDGDGKTEYTYDAPGALGKPWTMTSPSGVSTVLSYDAHGRPWKAIWTLTSPGGGVPGDGTYEIERRYDELGRLAQIRYPEVPSCAGCPRFAVGFAYTATGYLHQVTDARAAVIPPVFWQVDKRNADDLPVQTRWAPSLVSVGKVTPEETRRYDPLLGRLESIVTTATGGEIFHLGYGYDPNGNVTSRADAVIGRKEAFGYDASDRLKSWTLDTGEKRRTWSYEHDDLDNLKTVSEDGAPILMHTYGAVAPGAAEGKPHALESISGTTTQAYRYDARGRQIEGGGRGITWTDFDLPRRIVHAEGETLFDHDALGTRVRKTDRRAGIPVASTVTLAGLYERREDIEAGTVEHVFYVPGEGGPVAQVLYQESAGNGGPGKETTRYLQHDILGSIALVFDEAGVVEDRRFFEPFGQRIAADGGPFTSGMGGVELGFTGHRHDAELGLIDMRGRVYDPLQKHFLTPDPIIGAPLDGRDYNRYAYAWGNPLSLTDPTGLQEQPPVNGPLGGPLIISPLGPEPEPPPSPPQPPPGTQPAPPKSDTQGAAPVTGPGALPTPQETPPATLNDGATLTDSSDASWTTIAWSALKELARTAWPVGMAKQTIRSNDILGSAISLAGEGQWDAAGTLVRGLVQENIAGLRAGSLMGQLDAAMTTGHDVDQLMNPDVTPELRGVAGASAFQKVVGLFAVVAATAGGTAGANTGSAPIFGRVEGLRATIPIEQRGRITMAVGLAEDVGGGQKVLIATSEPRGYLRPGVTLAPGEILARGVGHAEANIVNFSQQHNLRLLEVGATRPICPACAALIAGVGARPVTPLKVP